MRPITQARTIERRIAKMEAWLQEPHLLEADPDAQYAEVFYMGDLRPLVYCAASVALAKPMRAYRCVL